MFQKVESGRKLWVRRLIHFKRIRLGFGTTPKRQEGNRFLLGLHQEGPISKNCILFKVKLMAKGYAQTKGINYNKFFSLVMKHNSIRILRALLARYHLELVKLDVKMALLHGDWKEQILLPK